MLKAEKYVNSVIYFFLTMMSTKVLAQESVEVGKYAQTNVDALSMVLSLLMVLALILASAWLLKRFNLVNKSVAGMKVITSLPLGHKEKLVVVAIGEEQLLLAVTSQQVTLIKTLDKPLEMDALPKAEFNQSLLQLFQRHKK